MNVSRVHQDYFFQFPSILHNIEYRQGNFK